MTDPAGTVVLVAEVTVPTVKARTGDRRRRRGLRETDDVRHCDLGGPDETTSDTALPVLTCVPETATG
jgi:hypothetical protein